MTEKKNKMWPFGPSPFSNENKAFSTPCPLFRALNKAAVEKREEKPDKAEVKEQEKSEEKKVES